MIHTKQPRSEQAVRVLVRAPPRFPSPLCPPQSRYSYSSRRVRTWLLRVCLKLTDQKKPKRSNGYTAKPILLLSHCWTVWKGCPKRPKPEPPQRRQGLLCHTAIAAPRTRWGSLKPLCSGGGTLPRFVHGHSHCSGRGIAPWASGRSTRQFQGACGEGESRGDGGLPLPARGGGWQHPEG